MKAANTIIYTSMHALSKIRIGCQYWLYKAITMLHNCIRYIAQEFYRIFQLLLGGGQRINSEPSENGSQVITTSPPSILPASRDLSNELEITCLTLTTALVAEYLCKRSSSFVK